MDVVLQSSILDKIDDLFFELDDAGKVRSCNNACENSIGLSKKDIIEKEIWEFFEGPDLKRLKNFFLKNNGSQKYKGQLSCNNSWFDVSCYHTSNEKNHDIILFARDITTTYRTLEEIKEREYQYRLLYENARELIVIHDLDGKYRYISSSVKKHLGYEPEELIGKSPYELIHKDDLVPIFDEPHRSTLAKEPISNKEYRIRRKDGEYIWFESYTKPIFDKDQNLIAFQSSSRNISSRKENEEKYRKVNDKLSQYREGLKLLSEITANADLSVSMQIQEALGVTTEFFGMKIGILSRIEDDKYYIESIYSYTDLMKGQEFELDETYAQIVHQKNELVAIENMQKSRYRMHPCYDKFKLESYIGTPYYVSGKVRGTIDFYSPISREETFDANELEFLNLLARWIGFLLQQHEYEKNLMADKIMLQAFVSSAPAAIAMFDTDFNYVAASDKWYADYDLEDQYIIGENHFKVFPNNGQDWEKIFKSAIKGNIEHNDEDLLEKNDGEIKWIKWEVRPWFKKLDTVGGLIMHTEDITYQKEQQLQLKIAKRKAEQASKAKEQFLSTMSHEIRTPLNAILGMTEIMLMDETEDEKLKHLKLLQFSGKNLLALINDILDFNKIEAGKLELEEIDFNLEQLLESTRNSLLNLAERKGLEISLKYDSSLPKYFKGDSIRLGQVITNLVNNAIKFTEEGYVAIKVRQNYREGNMVNLKIEVKDTGIGIAKSKIDKIFKSFEQASSDISRRYGGSGLGLAITKKILEVMGSTIQVHSAEGLGSVFFFELNLPEGETVADESAAHFDFNDLDSDLCILVAEDNSGNRILIDSLFKRWNIDVEFAYDGLEAVEKVQSKNYNMILMDLQMPEMDGYKATTEIRRMEDIYFKEIPIIALTASVMSNVLEKTTAVGMNGYVSKPFDPKQLRDVIIRYTKEFKHKPTKEKQPEIVEDVEEKASEIRNENQNESFQYLRDLIGNDEEALKDIVLTCIDSVETAVKGLEEGLKNKDIKKIRAELHVLRPNLHNLELEKLTKDLPQITEYSEEAAKILTDLIEEINTELSSEKFNDFKK